MTTVTMDVVMLGDGAGVTLMLNHLDAVFSPVGMQSFLEASVTPYLQKRAHARFSAEGDDASGKWAPLKPTTVKIREAGVVSGDFFGISGSHPINVRTHDMEQYITQGTGDITHEGTGNTSLHYPHKSPPGALKTKVRRAQVGGGNTVPRPVLAVNATDMFAIMSYLAYFIQGYGNGSNSQ